MIRKDKQVVKGSQDTVRLYLRWVSALVLLAFGLAASLLLAPHLKTWWLLLREPVVWAPRVSSPAPFLLVALGLAVALQSALSHLISGRASPRWASVGVILTASTLIFLSILPKPPESAPLRVTPVMVMDVALSELTKAITQAHVTSGEYPVEAKLLQEALTGKKTGYRVRLREVPFNVVAEVGFGPRLRAREGDLPATFYYVVAPNRKRYWVTLLMLDDVPTGRLVFAEDADGPLVVSRGAPDLNIP